MWIERPEAATSGPMSFSRSSRRGLPTSLPLAPAGAKTARLVASGDGATLCYHWSRVIAYVREAAAAPGA